MQIPDVNVLVSAFRDDATHHRVCRDWLEAACAIDERLGLSELALSGALRVLTHTRVFDPPTPTDAALGFAEALLQQPGAIRVRPGESHWRIFTRFCRQLKLAGNRIPDAYHAALCVEHGCEWVTLDRGFAAYPGLAVANPLIEA